MEDENVRKCAHEFLSRLDLPLAKRPDFPLQQVDRVDHDSCGEQHSKDLSRCKNRDMLRAVETKECVYGEEAVKDGVQGQDLPILDLKLAPDSFDFNPIHLHEQLTLDGEIKVVYREHPMSSHGNIDLNGRQS